MVVSVSPLIGAARDSQATPLPGRVRLMTLVLSRWLAIVGQVVAIFTVHFGLNFPLAIEYCLPVIAASAALNVIVSLGSPSTRRLSLTATAIYLAFDIAQLSLLLALTGGLENPFTILIVAPVAIAAATLPLEATLALVAFAFSTTTLLAFYHLPLPWREGETFRLPVDYLWGIWFAIVLAIAFTAVYVRRIAIEAKSMSDALAATQSILAREHRLSALGGLAAAAAHELGTPLATIALVAKELRRELPDDSPFAEDIALLSSQAQRCREILGRLSRRPEEGDAHAAQMPLQAFLEEIVSPHREFGIAIDLEIPADLGPPPVVLRRPELLHGLGNLVENAVDFAKSKVVISARWTDREIQLAIVDDGPGFSPTVIDRLGEPYITTRPAETNMRQGGGEDVPQGMGLGFFIAKTMIERIGGQMRFENLGGPGGARVDVHWPREAA